MDETPIAIDPYSCGCTECLIGEYIPAEKATREQKLAVIKGDMKNNSNDAVELTIRFHGGITIVEIYFLGETFEISNPHSVISLLGYYDKLPDIVNFDEAIIL